MTLVIPNAHQIGIEMSAGGQTIMNVIGINYGTGFYTIQEALADVKAAWEATGGPLKTLPNAVTCIGYHGVDLSTADAATAYLGSGATGTVASEMSTLAACAVIKLSGGSRSRSKNGRMYFGPLHEGQINSDGRTISSGAATTINAAFNQFRTAINVEEVSWAVLSRKLSEATPIASVGVQGVIGTQRRRLR